MFLHFADEAVNFARALCGKANEMMIVVPQITDLTGLGLSCFFFGIM